MSTLLDITLNTQCLLSRIFIPRFAYCVLVRAFETKAVYNGTHMGKNSLQGNIWKTYL